MSYVLMPNRDGSLDLIRPGTTDVVQHWDADAAVLLATALLSSYVITTQEERRRDQ